MIHSSLVASRLDTLFASWSSAETFAGSVWEVKVFFHSRSLRCRGWGWRRPPWGKYLGTLFCLKTDKLPLFQSSFLLWGRFCPYMFEPLSAVHWHLSPMGSRPLRTKWKQSHGCWSPTCTSPSKTWQTSSTSLFAWTLHCRMKTFLWKAQLGSKPGRTSWKKSLECS